MEKLRNAKRAKGLSIAAIARQADIPEPTVVYFFSKKSKAASIYTAGPICRVLGVSLDEVFGIRNDQDAALRSELLGLAETIIASFQQ